MQRISLKNKRLHSDRAAELRGKGGFREGVGTPPHPHHQKLITDDF